MLGPEDISFREPGPDPAPGRDWQQPSKSWPEAEAMAGPLPPVCCTLARAFAAHGLGSLT